MEKELKSCTGVILRADLTGRKGLDGHALLGQSSKGHPCRILILFASCSTTLLQAPHIKKLETYFALFIFLDFRTVWYIKNKIMYTNVFFFVFYFENEEWLSHECSESSLFKGEMVYFYPWLNVWLVSLRSQCHGHLSCFLFLLQEVSRPRSY